MHAINSIYLSVAQAPTHWFAVTFVPMQSNTDYSNFNGNRGKNKNTPSETLSMWLCRQDIKQLTDIYRHHNLLLDAKLPPTHFYFTLMLFAPLFHIGPYLNDTCHWLVKISLSATFCLQNRHTEVCLDFHPNWYHDHLHANITLTLCLAGKFSRIKKGQWGSHWWLHSSCVLSVTGSGSGKRGASN